MHLLLLSRFTLPLLVSMMMTTTTTTTASLTSFCNKDVVLVNIEIYVISLESRARFVTNFNLNWIFFALNFTLTGSPFIVSTRSNALLFVGFLLFKKWNEKRDMKKILPSRLGGCSRGIHAKCNILIYVDVENTNSSLRFMSTFDFIFLYFFK